MSNQASRFDIAIIGGGFSGAATAINLLRESWSRPVRIALIEQTDSTGTGLAYGTKAPAHVLNVQAGNMSAVCNDRHHFVDFLKRKFDQNAHWSDFVRRDWYGAYVQDTLHQAVENSTVATLETIKARVTDIEKTAHGFSCFENEGQVASAQTVVLALGVPKPGMPRVLASISKTSQRVITDPWDNQQLATIEKADDVLLLGSGLTMVDKVLELTDAGHRGKFIAISPQGFLPSPHSEKEFLVDGLPELAEPPQLPTALATLRFVRRSTATSANWRLVIDSMRKYSNEWWHNLSEKERRRFIEHLHPFWDTCRHRMACEVAKRIDLLAISGRLSLDSGQIEECKLDSERLQLKIRQRGARNRKDLVVDRIIICTGPEPRLTHMDMPLAQRLLEKGMLSSNGLGTGINVDSKLNTIDAQGKSCPGLSAIGSLLRGTIFETMAVRELREQARLVSSTLHNQLCAKP